MSGKIFGMPSQPTSRKIKRSFTLAPESVQFLHQTRLRRKANSDSEALDQLLKELRLAAIQVDIDAAYKDYYDTVSDEVLKEQHEWAEGAGPAMFLGIPE